MGGIFAGEKGKIEINRNRLASNPPDLIQHAPPPADPSEYASVSHEHIRNQGLVRCTLGDLGYGVWARSWAAFEKLGIHRIGQLRQLPAECCGITSAAAAITSGSSPGHRRAAGGAGAGSEIDLARNDLCAGSGRSRVMRAWLLELSEQVGCRLRRHGLKGCTVHLKVRFGDFHTITRAQTLPQPTNITQDIWQTAAAMFAERLPARRLRIRLLGVGVSGFEQPGKVNPACFPTPSTSGRPASMKSLIRSGRGSVRHPCSVPW